MPYGLATAGDVLTAANVNLLPRGIMAQTSVTVSGSANPGTTALLAAPSFTAVAGRRYKITIGYYQAVLVGSGTAEVQIRRGATQIGSSYVANAAGSYAGQSLVITDVPGAGAVTYNFYTFTGGTSIQMIASSAAPFYIIVEDTGA
jgi:hypothetical protein